MTTPKLRVPYSLGSSCRGLSCTHPIFPTTPSSPWASVGETGVLVFREYPVPPGDSSGTSRRSSPGHPTIHPSGRRDPCGWSCSSTVCWVSVVGMTHKAVSRWVKKLSDCPPGKGEERAPFLSICEYIPDVIPADGSWGADDVPGKFSDLASSLILSLPPVMLGFSRENDDDVAFVHAQLPFRREVLRRLHFGGNHLRHKVLQSFERRTVLTAPIGFERKFRVNWTCKQCTRGESHHHNLPGGWWEIIDSRPYKQSFFSF